MKELNAGPDVEEIQEHLDRALELHHSEKYPEALAIFKRLAEAVDPLSFHMVGHYLYHGLVAPPDKAAAFEWYIDGCRKQLPGSMWIAGKMLLHGDGIEADQDSALVLLEAAAEAGVEQAAEALTAAFFDGYAGVAQDSVRGFRFAQRGVELGSSFCRHKCGFALSNGIGTAPDLKRAFELYVVNVEEGYSDSAYNLGLAYMKGYGCEVDRTKAIECYRLAADSGLMLAQHNLAAALYDLREPENYSEIADWYGRAAAQGSNMSMNNLGLMYLAGEGVLANRAIALGWFIRAADAGYEQAREQVETLCQNLSESEIEEAVAMARGSH